jgi:phage-related protein
MAGPIRIAVLASVAAATKDIRGVGETTRKMGRDVASADSPVKKLSQNVTKLAGNALTAARSVASAVAPVAAVASAALAAAPALASAGTAVLNVARAAGGAAPALAAVAAAAIFVKLTMTQLAPAIAKSLTPITAAFKEAGAAAGELAAKGVRPLAKQFAKVGIPIVADAMNTIAVAANKVVKGFLGWANSTPGLVALRKITGQTADAFAAVAPHVLELATALGEMIGRIAGVSLAAGSSGLSKVLDLVTAKLKTITGATVQEGLDGLKRTFDSVRSTVVKVAEVVGIAVRVYQQYKTQILIIADTLAVLAIVFGGPVTAIIAAVGLVVRHLDFIKAAIADVRSAFATPGNTEFLDKIRAAVAAVWPAVVSGFQQIKAAVIPVLKEIYDKVRTELIPALGDFIAAAAPVVAFFVKQFAPIVARAFRTVAQAISGAVTVISGILKVFTGILTLNWRTVWAGIQQIVRGALGGIVSAVRDRFNAVRTAIGTAMTGALERVRSIIGRIRAAFTGISLFAAGARIVQSLIDGITSRAGAVIDKINDIAGSIRDHFPFSPAKRGPLKRKPMRRAGENVVKDLIRGMGQKAKLRRSLAQIAAEVSGFATPGLVGTPSAYTRGPATVNVIFQGLVTDPVGAGREVERVINRYRGSNGRALLA